MMYDWREVEKNTIKTIVWHAGIVVRTLCSTFEMKVQVSVKYFWKFVVITGEEKG